MIQVLCMIKEISDVNIRFLGTDLTIVTTLNTPYIFWSCLRKRKLNSLHRQQHVYKSVSSSLYIAYIYVYWLSYCINVHCISFLQTPLLCTYTELQTPFMAQNDQWHTYTLYLKCGHTPNLLKRSSLLGPPVPGLYKIHPMFICLLHKVTRHHCMIRWLTIIVLHYYRYGASHVPLPRL